MAEKKAPVKEAPKTAEKKARKGCGVRKPC